MESETKFAPQWLQAKQQSNSSNGPSRGGDGGFFTVVGGRDFNRNNGSGAGINSSSSVKLADHRYGREEMLALFDPSNEAPDDLKDHPIFVSNSLNPIAFAPMTEEPEVLSLQNSGSYGYKPYQRGGIMRGGLRGEYGGRGRGRGHDEGRLRPRDAWDDRPSKIHDHAGPSYDEGQPASHKTDFFSPSSHHNSFNRSNSNESWRSRNNFQDTDTSDFRRDRWGSKNWREGKNEIKEEGTFYRAVANKDSKPVDFRRSKSLYEEEESGQKMPEWSTANDDDLGVEGSFDSSGAFMTSKLKQEQGKATPHSPACDAKSVSREATSNPPPPGKESKEHRETSAPKTSTYSNPTEPTPPREEDAKSKPLATNHHAPTPVKAPAEAVLPARTIETTERNVSFKIDDRSTNLIHASEVLNSSSKSAEPVVASPFVHSHHQPASLPTAEPSMILPHPTLLHNQQFNYVRNSWYYVDPQGLTQGPFKDSDMAEWCFQGYFDLSLMLKAGETGEFMTLGAFSAKVGSYPFAQSRPGPMPNPMMQAIPTPVTQNISQTPRSLLSNIQHPVSTLNQDVLRQPYFYHQPVERPQQLHHQHPMQATSSFLPNLPRNASDNMFAASSLHMPSLNGDITDKVPWLQAAQVIEERGFDLGLGDILPPPSTIGFWNSGILTSSGNMNVSSRRMDYAGAAQQPKPSCAAQQLERMEAEKLRMEQEKKKEQMELQKRRDEMDYEQMRIIGEMMEEGLRRQQDEKRKQLAEQAQLEELQRREEMRARQELLEKMMIEEEAKRLAAQRNESIRLEEARLREEEEARKQEQLLIEAQQLLELQQAESLLKEEDFKHVDDSKKSKESKKNKKEAKKLEEAKKQEEAKQRQEELKRQEMLRKLEEQKKAEELKKKEEDEQVRKFKEAAEESKRKELEELNQRKLTKNVWTSSQSKPSVSKMNDIQNVEQERMRQQQIAEQKLIVEHQKQMVANIAKPTSGGSIWKSYVAKTPAPKSLLDIQMEQATQLDVPVKLPQPQVSKVSEVPFGSSRSSGSKVSEVVKASSAKVTEAAKVPVDTNKDATWEAAGSSGIKWMQKPPSLDNNQFPVLSGKGLLAAKKPVNKVLGKAETAAQKVFEAVKVKDELTEWCESTLGGLKTDVDISTLVDFLRTIKNPSEVVDYIHSYLGDSKQVKEFAKQFVERSIPQTQEINTWSVVGRQGNTSSKTQQDKASDKAAKKGKKKQQKDANFLLGFTVHADPDRTNVGEIDTTPPAAGLRK